MAHLTVADGNTSGKRKSEEAIVIISGHGDILLEIQDTLQQASICYRVCTAILKRASAYFENLLDPMKFNEGIMVDRSLKELRTQYSDISLAPLSALPRVFIADVGQFPKGFSNEFILTYFFKILHLPNGRPNSVSGATPLALLAVVADRFGAAEAITPYIKDIRAPLSLSTKEEPVRQKLLVGLLLGFDDWLTRCSNHVILTGSENWTVSDLAPNDNDGPLWWYLPGGVEEELAYRRECILATINSLQSHFLQIYSSKQRQCKLGYDSSPQCDSFQLGEMIRFFTRQGTLTLQSNIVDYQEPTPYTGVIGELIGTLRQCPEYQIDKNHIHCGLRTRFVPALEYIQSMLRNGICLRCWKQDRQTYSWLENPIGGTWQFKGSTHAFEVQRQDSCSDRHRLAKEMFTADHRSWTRDPSKG